jgi:hypothetical protein
LVEGVLKSEWESLYIFVLVIIHKIRLNTTTNL